MATSESRTLAVIGAGPKGLAVAVKAKILKELGYPVDRVVLIEKNGVAAHWSGDFGYTNGELKLGTSPEKDVVFPIATDLGDELRNDLVRRKSMEYTWLSFLVRTHRYTDWIDRGRPAPCHQLWASYLRWVAQQLGPNTSIVNAEVLSVDIDEGRGSWQLDLRESRSSNRFVLRADRLMLTGPGKTRTDFTGPRPWTVVDGVYDLESFWTSLKQNRFPRSGRTAIVGAGENAASVLLALGQFGPSLAIDVLSPKGVLTTRAENFYENQFYSQPRESGWDHLSLDDRVDFIHRTDLGVFSSHAMRILNDERRRNVVPGRVVEFQKTDRDLSLVIEYAGRISRRPYDQVILATGFDQIATLKALFTPSALGALEAAVGEIDGSNLSLSIREDLSVRGLEPKLHLPMLAGLVHGPGFANLSCLGLMADRVLLPTSMSRELSIRTTEVYA